MEGEAGWGEGGRGAGGQGEVNILSLTRVISVSITSSSTPTGNARFDI